MSLSPLAPGASHAPAAALSLTLFAVFALLAGPVHAGPVVGLVESFTGAGNLGLWGGGGTLTNPGTGGVGGAGDGYLNLAHQAVSLRLGTRNDSPDYVGDYLAAGADRIRFSLNDVGANQNLEIHFAIGT